LGLVVPTRATGPAALASHHNCHTLTSHVHVISSKAGVPWSTKDAAGQSLEVADPAWPAPPPGASWIWRTPTSRNEVVTFTVRFSVKHSARNVHGMLSVTADNAYKAYLNGRLVGANGPFSFDGPDEFTWATIYKHAVTPVRGANVLKIKALNYFGPSEPGVNPAGAVFRLRVTFDCPGKSCRRP
jgi:hypothetical protein